LTSIGVGSGTGSTGNTKATEPQTTSTTSTTTPDPEDKVWEELEKLSGAELKKRYTELAKQFPYLLLGGKPGDETDPDEEPPLEPMPVPTEGRVKDWGADTEADNWVAVKMRDDPNLWKVVDKAGKNVADNFTKEETAKYFIEYYQKTNTIPTDNPGTKPPVPDTPPPDEPDTTQPPPTESKGFPIPSGFTTIGEISTAFKFWGRTETNYASGGAGPSLRWDNTELPNALNILTGYEYQIGPEHGKRGDDNIGLKIRAANHNDANGGWYIPYVDWHADGSPAEAGCGKEIPHPSTSHVKFNIDGKDAKVANIKDGKKHGLLCAVFNDAAGVPTIMMWHSQTPNGNISSYEYIGKSKDTGNIKPGVPFTAIGTKGKKSQQLQIRIDEIPNAKIMNAFAVEIRPPANT
jgi:hypothetical protein